MKQYIDKDIIAAELEKRRDKNARNKLNLAAAFEDNYILSFIEHLEMKEVDMEEEFDNYANGILACDIQFEPFTYLHNCAKYFYELGLKAKGE